MPEWPDPQIQSSAAAFKAALIETLKEWPALTESTVTWGLAHQGGTPSTQIAVGDIKTKQRAAALGGHRREETMEQTVTVICRGDALDGVQPLSLRAWEIEKEIAATLRRGTGDITVRSTVRTAAIIASDLKEIEQGQQFEARLTIKIETTNRI